MKLPKKQTKKFLVAFILTTLVIAATGFYVFALNGSIFGWQPQTKTSQERPSEQDGFVNMEQPTEEQKNAGNSIKEKAIDDTSKDIPVTTLTVGFTSVQQSGDTLVVRATIDQLISEGACKLTLSKGEKTVTKTANIYASASVTTCQGFDIPVSELSAGIWNAQLNVTSPSASGMTSTSVRIE